MTPMRIVGRDKGIVGKRFLRGARETQTSRVARRRVRSPAVFKPGRATAALHPPAPGRRAIKVAPAMAASKDTGRSGYHLRCATGPLHSGASMPIGYFHKLPERVVQVGSILEDG